MRLGLVTPWFARESDGEIELKAWQLATRLAARGHKVDVLTTCCGSSADGPRSGGYQPGVTAEPEGFTIRRFPLDTTDRRTFGSGRTNGSGRRVVTADVDVPRVRNGRDQRLRDEPQSTALLDYLTEEMESYDRFLFLPYLDTLVSAGIAAVGERAVLQPCLSVDPGTYGSGAAAAFAAAGMLLFNNEGEQQLACTLFGPGIWPKCRLVGEGVETEAASEQQSSSQGAAPYVLYVARRDRRADALLMESFRRFCASRPNAGLHLKVTGVASPELPHRHAAKVENIGPIAGEEITSLLRGSVALAHVSAVERFSRPVLEAWMHGKPVAAHGDCLPTSVAVERARGGWVARTVDEWAELFAQLDRTSPAELVRLGQNGQAYASTWGDWEAILDRYEDALQTPAGDMAVTFDRPPRVAALDQYIPNCSYGDAITNHAIWIRDELRKLGHRSTIYARYIDPRAAHECEVFSPAALAQSDGVIYHHSIGSEITAHVLQFDGPKCLIYHNITPARFFAPFRPEFAAIVQRGRDDLHLLAAEFQKSFGVSVFNATELSQSGFNEPGVLPIAIDPRKWNIAPDPAVLERMRDGRTNLLFVGRIAPNKKQDDLVRAFQHYLSLDRNARLVLVGKAEPGDLYAAHLHDLVRTLGLEDSVLAVGSISDAELAAYYRTAHLFWSMSEHEGFCVPLVEAMWFDVPIFAFDSSAITETLGEGGLLFTSKENLMEVATAAQLLVTDQSLRRSVIAAQQRRREAYVPDKVRVAVHALAADLAVGGRSPHHPTPQTDNASQTERHRSHTTS